MDSTENTLQDHILDRNKFRAFEHFYIPPAEMQILYDSILHKTPPTFIHLAESFNKNVAAVISTARMPFSIASANYSQRLFHQYFMAEKIRTLKAEFDQRSEAEKIEIARAAAQQKFTETMKSEEEIHKSNVAILSDLENLLTISEMTLAAAELMRQSTVLTWGALEVLSNDLFICLLNARPKITETLLQDERTKKRFQLRDLALPLSTYEYDLSHHMGDVLRESVRIDDVDTLRTVYDVLFPKNPDLQKLLCKVEVWKLNQRRNLIVHRRSVVDETYIKNTGDALPIGSELIISPERFEEDLALVIEIGRSMLVSLSMFI